MTLDIEINPIEFIEDDSVQNNVLRMNLWKNS